MGNKRISYTVQADGSADVTIPPELVQAFQVLVQRAVATWQDQDPHIRDFADRVLGRDKFVGKNMKENMLKTKIRECCNTFVTEPHHTQCPELAKIRKTPLCDGHPETCNCPRHCR